jgi:hypothetical protein
LELSDKCKEESGEVVPIPTFPLESILILSVPPSVNAMVSAAGAKSPVFVSPVKVILGSDAVPAENIVGAVKVGLPDESSFGAKFARLRGIAMIKLLG